MNLKRTRHTPEDNYFGIFNGEITLRFAIDDTVIKYMQYPDLTDISIASKCYAACKYCYTSAVKEGDIYSNVCEKLDEVYGSLNPNYRPFQVAYGGEGEPTLHPEFAKIMKKTLDLQICPNYTTNGMHLSEDVLRATRDYCGGVAVSLHPHLKDTWRKAVDKLLDYGVKNVVLHVIVGEPGTTDLFYRLLDEYDKLKYVVALPYQVSGRAPDVNTREEWLKFFDIAFKRDDRERMPIGALFYDFLMEEKIGLNEISIHEPEKYSGYRIMSDSKYKTLLKSSYIPIPKFPHNNETRIHLPVNN